MFDRVQIYVLACTALGVALVIFTVGYEIGRATKPARKPNCTLTMPASGALVPYGLYRYCDVVLVGGK